MVWVWGFRFVTCLLLCLDVVWFACGLAAYYLVGDTCLIYCFVVTSFVGMVFGGLVVLGCLCCVALGGC